MEETNIHEDQSTEDPQQQKMVQIGQEKEKNHLPEKILHQLPS